MLLLGRRCWSTSGVHQYIWQISQPMGMWTQLSSVLQSASAATKRVFEILDEPEEKKPK